MDAALRLLRAALTVALLAAASLGQTQPAFSQELLCGVFGSQACVNDPATTTTPASQPVATPATTQEQLCEIFKGPACVSQPDATTSRPEEIPGLYESCPCPDGVTVDLPDNGPSSASRCECVMFYQCDNSTGEYNAHGQGLINIRKKGGCPDPLTRCCKISGPPGKRSPTPHPNWPTPTPLPDNVQCGVRNQEGIILKVQDTEDGETEFGELPWMVGILETGRAKGPAEVYKCGGSLIKDNVVLTAAHCVKKPLDPSKIKVRAGDWDRESTTELLPHQDRFVSRVVKHDRYHDAGGNIRYDVALLILESPFILQGTVGTICLPEASDGSPFDNKECLVSGWGKDKLSNSWLHRYLKRLELPIVPRGQCQDMLQDTMLGPDFQVNESFLCAGGVKGKDACKGDGGGPLACPMADGRYELAGVVSWGLSCGMANVPGLYANIALVRPWIDEVLAGL